MAKFRQIWSHWVQGTMAWWDVAEIDLFASKGMYQMLPPKQPMWPDLAKFRHFGKSLQVLGKFLIVYFLFGKMLSLLWQICDIIGLIFIVANGQILKNNITIRSHWKQHKSPHLKLAAIPFATTFSSVLIYAGNFSIQLVVVNGQPES